LAEAKKPVQLWKRLPLILFVMVGVWLWRGGAGLFAIERELVWQLPGDLSTIRAVEIQVWDGNDLLKREELSFPAGVKMDVVQKLPLRAGSYQAKVFISRDGSATSEPFHRELRVEESEVVVTSLRR
jgi:hypothetical protein